MWCWICKKKKKVQWWFRLHLGCIWSFHSQLLKVIKLVETLSCLPKSILLVLPGNITGHWLHSPIPPASKCRVRQALPCIPLSLSHNPCNASTETTISSDPASIEQMKIYHRTEHWLGRNLGLNLWAEHKCPRPFQDCCKGEKSS